MGGAKNCPETPRQKMIGMMYLVLTAMLALNVSTDILNGFTMVDNSLHSSIVASDTRNERLYLDFGDALAKNPAKTQEWYDKAQEVKVKADSLYTYLTGFKNDLTIMVDGKSRFDELTAQNEDPTLHIKNNSNFDITGTYAIVMGHGQELKSNVGAYCDYLVSLVNPSDSALIKTIKATLATEKGYNAHDRKWVDWEVAVFDGMPIGASMAVLTKLQNDVRSTEGMIVQYLANQTDAGDLRVNKTSAFVIPTETNVLKGGKYTARIILAAEDTTKRPQFFVDGVKINEHGVYEVSANTLGKKQYSGFISYMQNDQEVRLPFSGEYMVSEPAVTISNTELNVLYAKHDNKFAVSVPGISDEKVKVSVSGASVKQQGRLWIINPPESAKEVTISVSAEIENKMQAMGSMKYRVKVLPPPNAYFAVRGKEYANGAKVPYSFLSNPDAELIASYGEDGLLEVPWKVTSFSARIGSVTLDSKDNKFTKDQLNRIARLDRGALVFIENIQAVGEGGVKKPLSPITLIVN